MQFVEWSEMYGFGIPEIDTEHKELINIANSFFENIKNKKDVSAITQTLNYLTKYAQTHFTHEEQILKKMGLNLENLEHHKKAHEELIEKIFAVNANASAEIVKDFLTDWLILHLLIEDRNSFKLINK